MVVVNGLPPVFAASYRLIVFLHCFVFYWMFSLVRTFDSLEVD
jgi:hypothetical protein